MTYCIEKIRSDFPILSRKINNYPLTYLDSASSAQKPNVVINSESQYYRNEYSSVHRSIHTLSIDATDRVENVREKIASFINADSVDEIVFVKGSTEGINLIANSWGRLNLKSGDNILITEMEHHANIVPWQMLAKEKDAYVRYIPLLPDGTLDIIKIPKLIDDHTRLCAITHISNVLGTINPLSEIISKVRSISNAMLLVDGAQGILHQKVDVKFLDCDFYVFSGHKLYGPSGIGVLYAKKQILESMPPWEGGGSMIRSVSLTKGTIYNDIPWRFEAGTPNIAGIIGLGAAINYIEQIGLDNIHNYKNNIMCYTIDALQKIKNIKLYGSKNRVGIISFNLDKHHAYDVGVFLNQYGVAIRTGHHCAMPIMDYFNVSSMCRISFAMYTDKGDIDRLMKALIKVQSLLS